MNVQAHNNAGNFAALNANPTDSTAFRTLALLPNIVNGDPNNFVPIFVAPGIADRWKWTNTVNTVVNSDATFRKAVTLEATMMLCYAGATVTAADVRMATYVAVLRTVMRHAWTLEMAEVENAQTLTITADHTEIDATTGNFVHAGPNNVNVADKRALFDRVDAEFAAKVDTIIPGLIRLATGVPLIVGTILVYSSGHHFVPQHKNIAVGLVRQVFGAQHVAEMDLPEDDFYDVVFHKAAHPLVTGWLVGQARNAAHRAGFTAMGLAAAIVRVPAKFAHERAGSAIIRLVTQVNTLGESNNVVLAAATITAAIEGTAIADGDNITPALITARADAYTQLEASNAADIGFCIGFYRAAIADTDAGAVRDTLLRSYAIRRLIQSEAASVAIGEAQ